MKSRPVLIHLFFACINPGASLKGYVPYQVEALTALPIPSVSLCLILC